MKIKCLLVDDVSLALALLEKFVGDTPDLEVVAQCKSANHIRIPVVRARKQTVTALLFGKE